MRIPRYIEGPVRAALDKKIVLVGGPRQVGKTTFALGLLGILENLYVCFRISPYGPPSVRAVKKAQKLYL